MKSLRSYLAMAAMVVSAVAFGQISNDASLKIKNSGTLAYLDTYAPNPEIEGDYLYFGESKSAVIYLREGTGTYKIENANIDLINQAVVVDIKDNLYSINYSKIDSAVFEDIRVMDYKLKSSATPESAMAIVLKEDKTILYKTVTIQLIKPNYNEALDTGSRNYTLRQKVKYFLDLKEKGVLDLSKKLKSFKGTSYYDQVKKFVKNSGTDFTADQDMMKLADFINSII